MFLLLESMGGLCNLVHLLSDGVKNDAVDVIILCRAVLQDNSALLPPKVGQAIKGAFMLLC